MAEFWIRGIPNGSAGYPSYSQIQEYKRAGFNAVMIVEIRQNQQMNDFDNIIIPNPQDNPFKECIDQINSLEMDVYILMNPVRYGVLNCSNNTCVGGTNNNNPCNKQEDCPGGYCESNGQINKNNFLKSSTYQDKFLSHIEFIVNNYQIAGIQIEEGYWEVISRDIQMSFLQCCRAKIPSNIMFSANHASADSLVVSPKWNLNLINSGVVFDFVSYQTSSGDGTGNMTNYDLEAGLSAWKKMLPYIPICSFTYLWSQGKVNPGFLLNVEYCAQKGYNLQVWPSSNISDYSQVKTIFDRYPLPEPCPRPQFSFNINQV